MEVITSLITICPWICLRLIFFRVTQANTSQLLGCGRLNKNAQKNRTKGTKESGGRRKRDGGDRGNNQRVPWMKKELGYGFVFLLKIDIFYD